MRLNRYMVLNEGKYSFKKLKNDPKSFYNKPKMVGHTWAKETADSIESLLNKVVKTEKQRILADILFNFDTDDWHYFNNITKKSIQIYSYILRRIDKQEPFVLLNWHNNKAGLWKDPICHILEYLSYKKNTEEYLKSYSRAFGFYGMTSDDARKRFYRYHESLKKYDYIKEIIKRFKLK